MEITTDLKTLSELTTHSRLPRSSVKFSSQIFTGGRESASQRVSESAGEASLRCVTTLELFPMLTLCLQFIASYNQY